MLQDLKAVSSHSDIDISLLFLVKWHSVLYAQLLTVPERPGHSRISYRCPGRVLDDTIGSKCPGIFANLDFRRANMVEFSSLLEAKKVALGTLFNTKLMLVSILGTPWLFATPINKLWPAKKWAGFAKRGGVNIFRDRENNCPRSLIQKVGKKQHQ